MMFFWPLGLILLLFLLLRPAYGCCGWGHRYYAQPPAPTAGDPMETIRRRLALGEITPEEFEKIRDVLSR